MKSNVIHGFRTAVGYFRDLVEPIDPAKLAVMPKTADGVALNPPAWLIPHLTVSLAHVVKMLGGEPDIPRAWMVRYTMKTNPTESLADYPDKQEALAQLDAVSDTLVEALEKATDEQLAAATPNEDFRKLVPTVGDAVTFIAILHTATHAGQLTSWRRCMGMGPRF